MTQELDFTFLRRALSRRWWLIVLLVVLAAAGAVLFGLVRPPVYQAQAQLLARAPKYQWRFNASVLPIVDERRDWRREFMLLGQTIQVARRVAEQVGDGAAGSALLRRVSFRPDATDRIILEASGPTPQAAADLANTWSRVLQAAVSERYGTVTEAQTYADLRSKFEAQLQGAQSKLEAFKAQTGQSVGATESLEAAGLEPDQKELDSKARLLADYRVALDNVNRLAQEVADAQAGRRAPSSIPWELLQDPILLQRAALKGDQLPAQSDLPAWAALLQAEAAGLQDLVNWLNDDVIRLQTQLAREDSELYRLTRERNLAAESYETVRRKLNEIEVQEAVDPVGIEILDAATPPEAPSSWPLTTRLAVAIVGGLVAGLWLALFWEYLAGLKVRIRDV